VKESERARKGEKGREKGREKGIGEKVSEMNFSI
jgi:hypothetical protein